MNGDNQLISVLCVANLWKKLMVWAVCVQDVPRTLDRLPAPAGGSVAGTPAVAVEASPRASFALHG